MSLTDKSALLKEARIYLAGHHLFCFYPAHAIVTLLKGLQPPATILEYTHLFPFTPYCELYSCSRCLLFHKGAEGKAALEKIYRLLAYKIGILKYYCERFEKTPMWNYFNTITGAFIEKNIKPSKFWHSNNSKQLILIPKLKKDERYPKFFKTCHVDIGPHDLLNRL